MKRKNNNNIDIIEVRARRFAALIIDWYLTNMLAVIPITFYLRGNDYLKPYMFDLTHYNFSTGLGLGIYGILIGIIYYIFIPVFLFEGQTLGKKFCKIKIIKENKDDVSLKDMIVRELVGSTLLEGGMLIIPTYLRKILPLFSFNMIVDPLQYIAYILTIVSIVYAYFQPNSQAFHDKIAKTMVVKL